MNIFFVAVVLIIVIFILQRLFKRNELRERIDLIPGPPGHPIIGNLLNLFGTPEQLWKYFRSLSKQYYPIYRMHNAHLASVGLLTPDDIEILLSSKKHLRKTKVYEWLQPWLGTGLLTSAGEKWAHRRKILTPAFHFNILQEFVEIFNEQGSVLVEKLKGECLKPSTDLVPIVTQFTLHSICETAMGTRLDETTKEAQEYTRAVYRMGEILVHRITRPWLFFKNVYRLVPEYYEQNKLLSILHNFTASVIEERKNNFNEDVSFSYESDSNIKRNKRLAMLDLLISAKNRGVPINDEGIREEVDTFMFEGHDTTTSAISFTLMLLANYPDIQEKAAQEVFDVCGNSNNDIAFSDLGKLRYLEQVIKESLRLYPSVPLITRIADEDIHTASGYTIPANVYVQVHIFDLHYNPEIYPDPHKFDPERFSPENSRGRHPFAYLPFSAGPRNCIGQKFAMLEIKTVLSIILRNFIVRPIDTREDIDLIVHLVLKAQNGIKIKFLER